MKYKEKALERYKKGKRSKGGVTDMRPGKWGEAAQTLEDSTQNIAAVRDYMGAKPDWVERAPSAAKNKKIAETKAAAKEANRMLSDPMKQFRSMVGKKLNRMDK